MHVLIIPSTFPTSHAPASGIFYRDQALALQEQGVQVGVVYPAIRSLRTLHGGGLNPLLRVEQIGKNGTLITRQVPNPLHPVLRGHLYRLVARNLVKSYLMRVGKPDLIHAHGMLWAGVTATSIAKALDVPFVVTCHSSAFSRGLVTPRQVRMIKTTLEKAAKVWAVSPQLAAQIKEVVDVPAGIDIMPNMVDTDFFSLPPILEKSNRLRLITVASLVKNKNVDILLKAIASARNDDLCLDIIGEGDQRPMLEKLAKDLCIDGRVTFHGFKSRDSIRTALWNSDCFVLPSLHETFGVVLIEAMSTGLPVVATNNGGPASFVGREQGWLVPPTDVDNLVMVLNDVGDRIHTFDRVGIRQSIIDRFSCSRIATDLAVQYRFVLNM